MPPVLGLLQITDTQKTDYSNYKKMLVLIRFYIFVVCILPSVQLIFCYSNCTHLCSHIALSSCCWCCDRKVRAASAQSFTLWQQARIKIMRRSHSIIACSCNIYMAIVLRAHPVRGESHIQRNASGEVATPVAR